MSKFISSIYNYCDRWCERCEFSSRCRVANDERNLSGEELDINNKAFWKKIASNFTEAQKMLTKAAEKFGIDLNAISDEEFAAIHFREKTFIQNHALTKLSLRYIKESKNLLENKKDFLLFSNLDEERKDELLEIIYWYQMFISVKIQRGLNGLLDFEGNFDNDELENTQSEANGSIKISLIAIERSKMAWTILTTMENSNLTKPLISLLESIKEIALKEFPNANEFIRPGFDEIETVM